MSEARTVGPRLPLIQAAPTYGPHYPYRNFYDPPPTRYRRDPLPEPGYQPGHEAGPREPSPRRDEALILHRDHPTPHVRR